MMDRTAPTIALAMIHDDVDLETEVHSGDIVLFNSLLMYNRNRFDAGALLTIWNATLAIGKTSPTRSPHLIYRETHAQAFGAGTDGLYTAHTTCGAIDPTLATGNWRDALLAPILNRYNYQTLAIHELSALFAALVPHMAMSAPAWAMAIAMPSPMPRLPPVTSATLPVKSKAL